MVYAQYCTLFDLTKFLKLHLLYSSMLFDFYFPWFIKCSLVFIYKICLGHQWIHLQAPWSGHYMNSTPY